MRDRVRAICRTRIRVRVRVRELELGLEFEFGPFFSCELNSGTHIAPCNEPDLRPSSAHRPRSRGDQQISIVRQLQADNERLRNELATAKANLGNRYLRSVLNLIGKHRDMGFGSLDVIDDRLVLHDEGDEDGETTRKSLE